MVIEHGVTAQNQIKRTLSTPENTARVRKLLKANPDMKRTELADFVCDEFGFRDSRGQRQRAGCLKALRKLEEQGAFTLPAAQRKSGPGKPRGLGRPVPVPQGVPERVDGIRELELVLVETEEELRLWNELMLRDHPQGEKVMVGRQLRYLVRSEHGWLGGLGFAASALYLESRDHWIGWDSETRQAHLDRVVGLSRFLIRKDVDCLNLASRVLGMCIRRFPADFEKKYQYEPWLLETFVDPTWHSGACYRATNWVYVGKTRGRGRQSRSMEATESVKEIYVYPLVRDFRGRMGLPADAGLSPIRPEEGLDGERWAEHELGGASLGDERLTRRLVEIAKRKAAHPEQSWLQACQGDRAATKGYYRFMAHPDTSAVNMETILQSHGEQTLRRMQGQNRVLALHDETELDYASLDKCEGLGIIGKNQTQTESKGLGLHTTLAVTANTGLPLGLLGGECYAPQPKPEHRGKDRRTIPIEDKETFRWVKSLRQAMDVSKRLPATRLINVMDREGDFFELFDEWRQNPCVDLLIRAKHDRRVVESGSLFESVKGSRVRARFVVDICRRSARPPKGKRSALPARPARQARMALRYQKVTLRPPRFGLNRHKEPMSVWVIHAVEERPPAGQDRLEWTLLTTVEIDSVERAIECVKWYALRWRIEDWHKILQSGCRVEEAAHERRERLERVIAVSMVVAWRIHIMTLLAREAPELPADVLFTDIEIEVLHGLAQVMSAEADETTSAKVTEPKRKPGQKKNDRPSAQSASRRGNLTQNASVTR